MSEGLILMRCIKKGCPRTRRLPRPEDVGINVVEIYSYCPWHEKSGMKEYPEYFFDAKGRALDWETWKPIKTGNEVSTQSPVIAQHQ